MEHRLGEKEIDMILLEFIDEHLMSHDIDVYSSAGNKIAHIECGDESGLAQVRDYSHGEVVKTVETETGVAAYVNKKPLDERPPVVMGYPGELPDEAAFSSNWRAREPKASNKQVAFLAKHHKLYLSIRKPHWPMDPQQLLRYEASDAMTEILNIIRKED